MRYAKFIDRKKIEYEPKSVTIGQTHYNPPPQFWRDENHYFPVVETDPPEYKEGYYACFYWELKDNKIIMVWEYLPSPENND